MSQIRLIFKNISWLLISQIIASICGFIWTIIIARYLGVNDYGVLGFAISLTGILAVTADLGISTHVVRHIATDYESAPKYFGNVIPLKGLLSIGTFLLTLIILIILKSNQLTITITLLFTIETIIKSFIVFFNGCFQAFEKGKYQGVGNTILNLILLIFILISVFTNLGLYGIVFSYILANLIALGYAYIVLNKHLTHPQYEFDRIFNNSIIKSSLPFAIGGILISIYYSIDMVMLSNLVGDYPTGIYNAAYKLISVLTLFYSAYTAVIFPVMSKLFKNNKETLMIYYEKSIKYLLLIMIPLAHSIVIYSSDIIQLIYGHEYIEASKPLSILIWTVCLLFISGVGSTLINASHQEMAGLKLCAIAAIFNITFNFFMIPFFSYIGAAITTVLSDLLIVILQLIIIYKLGHRINKNLLLAIGKIIVGTIILGSILYVLDLNMWLALPVGIIIYLTIVYLLRFFDEDDKYIIKEILNKN